MFSRLLALFTICSTLVFAHPVFDVKDYGASGIKSDDARPARQRAIDTCGEAGGDTVYIGPGEYSTGQLHLRSGVRLYLEAGATLFASLDNRQFDGAKGALIYGEDLHDVALEGRGTLDGQSSYEWRQNNFTDHDILSNQRLMEATGKPLMRPFPHGFPEEKTYPRMVLMLRCTDLRRFDWFWWGDGDPLHFNIKRRSEVNCVKRDNEPAAGRIRNVLIQNVIAHGTGPSVINGHPESWLEGVRLNNVKLFVASDPSAPYEHTATALTIRKARDLPMSNVEIHWEKPYVSTWRDGLRLQEVKDAVLDHVEVNPAPGSHSPATQLEDVTNIVWPK